MLFLSGFLSPLSNAKLIVPLKLQTLEVVAVPFTQA